MNTLVGALVVGQQSISFDFPLLSFYSFLFFFLSRKKKSAKEIKGPCRLDKGWPHHHHHHWCASPFQRKKMSWRRAEITILGFHKRYISSETSPVWV